MAETPDAFHTHRLSNGLQIIGQRMPDFESVAISFHIRTGARDELDPTVAGIYHFLEHMVFKGTKKRTWQQLRQAFTRIGAEKNGATSVESTIYWMRVLEEYLDQAVEILSDMISPRLDERDFEAEKEVIINEIARSEDQPDRYAERRMMHAYFECHTLGNYVLGTRESIRDLHLEQMREYCCCQFVDNNMILSAVGNFDWDHLTELAEQYCHEWPCGEATRVVAPYQPAQSSYNIIVNTMLKQQHILVAMPGIGKEDRDYYAAILAKDVLGETHGSRLYWHIRQKGLAQSSRCTL